MRFEVSIDGIPFPQAGRVDVIVEGKVIAEPKAVDEFRPVHAAQLLTYLKHTGAQVGYLLDFHAPRMSQGLRRFVRTA